MGFTGGSDNASDELLVGRSRNWCNACAFLSVMVSLNEIRGGSSEPVFFGTILSSPFGMHRIPGGIGIVDSNWNC